MQISLRDPGGQTCLVDNRVLRVVNKEGLRDLAAFLRSSSSARFVESDQLVNTSFLGTTAMAAVLQHEEVHSIYEEFEGASIVEHERVPFPSFPYECPPEMLHAAAMLTLDLAENLIDEGLGLKDASPYNVLFRPAVNQQTLWPQFGATTHDSSRWRRAGRSVSSFETDTKTPVAISVARVNSGLANAATHS